jgi:hypothetical protein
MPCEGVVDSEAGGGVSALTEDGSGEAAPEGTNAVAGCEGVEGPEHGLAGGLDLHSAVVLGQYEVLRVK